MKKIFILIAVSGILLSCEKDDPVESYNPPANKAPVANAGADQILLLPANQAYLDGTASSDPDGRITGYRWTKISGPASFVIKDHYVARTEVKDLVEGTYQFELRVTDDKESVAKDTTQITVYPASITGCDISGRALLNATMTEIGTLSVARMPFVAAAGNKVVFAGGVGYTGSGYTISSAVDIYDINNKAWTRAQLNAAREGIAAVSNGDIIFFAGGGFFYGSYDVVDIYDVKTNTWTVAKLSEPRAYLTAAAVGSKVLFAGGFTDGWDDACKRVDIYDLATTTWSTAELAVPRANAAAVVVGNKVYFAGGDDWDYGPGNGEGEATRIDIYDNATNRWSTSTLKELKGLVSGAAIGDQIYWGGLSQQLNTAKAEVFNTGNNSTTILGCLSYPRQYPTAVVRNNEIAFFPMGMWINDDKAGLKGQFDVYNPSTGKWSIGFLAQPVEAAGIISVDNSIYIGGGRTAKLGCTNKVYKISW